MRNIFFKSTWKDLSEGKLLYNFNTLLTDFLFQFNPSLITLIEAFDCIHTTLTFGALPQLATWQANLLAWLDYTLLDVVSLLGSWVGGFGSGSPQKDYQG